MDNLVELCHCGHHKTTHYWDELGSGDCTGVGCNDCHRFRDATKPDPDTGPGKGKPPRKPDHTSRCMCADCVAYLAWNNGKDWRREYNWSYF